MRATRMNGVTATPCHRAANVSCDGVAARANSVYTWAGATRADRWPSARDWLSNVGSSSAQLPCTSTRGGSMGGRLGGGGRRGGLGGGSDAGGSGGGAGGAIEAALAVLGQGGAGGRNADVGGARSSGVGGMMLVGLDHHPLSLSCRVVCRVVCPMGWSLASRWRRMG